MGFGGATARLFAREGAKVVVSDIDEEKGETTASQIRERGGDAIFVRLDVTREPDWIGAVRLTATEFGRLDILVNSAATTAPAKVEDTTVEVWDGQMAVHGRAVFLGAKHAIPEMRKVGGGSIINVSSIFGLVGSTGSTAYHAAKGAVRLFTKAAAVQYAKEGIRVNSVHPGFALTPLTERRFADKALLEYRLSSVPMGRLGSVEEIAYGILYLASDEASFVTGAELVIDGGMTAQ
jgi:cyclopentanol dehydrogenase